MSSLTIISGKEEALGSVNTAKIAIGLLKEVIEKLLKD